MIMACDAACPQYSIVRALEIDFSETGEMLLDGRSTGFRNMDEEQALAADFDDRHFCALPSFAFLCNGVQELSSAQAISIQARMTTLVAAKVLHTG